MILSIGWKEYREQRMIWLTMAVVSGAALYAAVALYFPSGFQSEFDENKIINLMLVTVGLVATYGLVSGATLLAGEREGSTLVWLDNLTGLRSGVWFSKLLTGAVMSVAQGLVLAGLLYYLGVRLPKFEAWNWFWVMPAAALEALMCGLLVSSFCKSALPAAGLASLPLGFIWGLGSALWHASPVLSVAVRVVFLLIGLGLSWFIFCGEDIGRFGPLFAEPVPARGRRIGPPRRRPQRRAVHGPIKGLLWLTWRQGKTIALTLGMIALVWGWLLPFGGLILWPFGTLLMGVIFGMAVFFDEQANGSARFLGDHRLPLGKIWGVKMAFWLVLAFLIVDLSFVSGLFHIFTLSWSGANLERTNLRRSLEDDLRLLRTMGFLPYLVLWFFYGFSVSQLCVMLFRKGAVALVVAAGVSAGLAAVWIPSLAFGGLHLWQVLTGPLLLLLASRLLMWAWVSDRLYTPRAFVTLGACVAASALWLAANIGYRAVEVPDTGEPFDVPGFVASLPKFEDNHAGNLIRSAVRELQNVEQDVQLQFAERQVPRGRPRGGRGGGGLLPPGGVQPPPAGMPGGAGPGPGGLPPFPGPDAPDGGGIGGQDVPPAQVPPFPPDPDQREKPFDELVGDVLGKGWSAATPDFSRRLDALFRDDWAHFDLFQSTWFDRLREMSRQPLGVVENPKDLSRLSNEFFQTMQGSRRIANFLAVRALQLQARGRHEEALDCLFLDLALARNLCNKAILSLYLTGLGVEGVALRGLDVWVQEVGPRPELLRRALAELNRHEHERPPASDVAKAEYLVSRNTFLNGPFFSAVGLGSGAGAQGDSLADARDEVLSLSAQVPWEKTRQERLLNAIYSGWVRAFEIEPRDALAKVAAARAERQRAGRSGRAERVLDAWLPAESGPGAGLSRERLGDLIEASWFQDVFFDIQRPLDATVAHLCRVRAGRIKLALAVYRAETGRTATRLEQLSAILPELPLDPYSGQPFCYRISSGEMISDVQSDSLRVAPGQGVLWSVGPDLIDHGGLHQGTDSALNDPGTWEARQLDFIFLGPRWEK